MKEFILTQSYGTLDEMLNSGEVAVYKEELMQGEITEYAIVSRIGNRYDIYGQKIENFALNPFYNQQEVHNVTTADEIEEIKVEDKEMKYSEIEVIIDNEIAKAVEQVKNEYEVKIAQLNEQHAIEIANAKAEAKAELIAKLTA